MPTRSTIAGHRPAHPEFPPLPRRLRFLARGKRGERQTPTCRASRRFLTSLPLAAERRDALRRRAARACRRNDRNHRARTRTPVPHRQTRRARVRNRNRASSANATTRRNHERRDRYGPRTGRGLATWARTRPADWSGLSFRRDWFPRRQHQPRSHARIFRTFDLTNARKI